MNTQEFVNHINALRLNNKNKWFFDQGTVNGKNYNIKCYNTYLQRCIVDNIEHGGLCDISVKEFKKTLERAANYLI